MSVPVLSKMMVVMCCAFWSASAFLMRMPCSAPLPVPTMIAVGVARPSAHGHAMMRTATNVVSAKGMLAPVKYHVVNAMNAIIMTAGTKYALMVSASFCMGALLPCASSTSLMICASAVSAPIFVALKVNVPVLLMVAPMTVSPLFFSTGMLSPVIIDSSTEECPEMTLPSTGIFCPGLTMMMSPTRTSSMGIFISFLLRMTSAVFAWSPMSFLMASLVFPFAIASKYLPRRMNAMRSAATS